jgi:hypothetical protein
MSYHFRLILTRFSGRGTTLSYFFGSSRTGETDSLDRLCDRADWLHRPTLVRQHRIRRDMGTIIGRTRKDGSKAFVAQIVIKKAGAIVHREAEKF